MREKTAGKEVKGNKVVRWTTKLNLKILQNGVVRLELGDSVNIGKEIGERLIFLGRIGKPNDTHLRVLLIIIIPQNAKTKLAQCSSIPTTARGLIKPKGNPGPFPPDVT